MIKYIKIELDSAIDPSIPGYDSEANATTYGDYLSATPTRAAFTRGDDGGLFLRACFLLSDTEQDMSQEMIDSISVQTYSRNELPETTIEDEV